MVPVVAIVGASDSGKTRLIERVLPLLWARGLRVGTCKHASHGFEIDRPGSDSARHRAAGAHQVLLVGPDQRALLSFDGDAAAPRTETRHTTLATLVHRHLRDCDLVLAEGFTWEPGPKVLVHRRGIEPKVPPSPADVVLVVTDEPLGYDCELDPDALGQIAARLADVVLDHEPADHGVTLLVDGDPIPLTAFVSDFLAGAVTGMVGELKGIPDHPRHIELFIERS